MFVYSQGAKPRVYFFKGQIEKTPAGCVVADREMAASVLGLSAAGDLVCLHVKQAIVTADGLMAAMAVSKYLHGRERAQPDWQ